MHESLEIDINNHGQEEDSLLLSVISIDFNGTFKMGDWTAVDLQKTTDFFSLMSVLLQAGADVYCSTRCSKSTCLHLLLDRPESWDEGDAEKIPKALALLLQYKADIYATDNVSITFNGHRITRSVTRCAYATGRQDLWWSALSEAGYSRLEVLQKEATELNISLWDYERGLDWLAGYGSWHYRSSRHPESRRNDVYRIRILMKRMNKK